MRKKIIITHEYAPFRGGVATYCAEAARAAAAMGHEVEVWTTGPRGETRENGVTIRRLGACASLRPGPLFHFARALFSRRGELAGSRVILGSVGAQMIFLQLHRLGLLRGVAAVPLFHGSEILRYQRNPWLGGPARRWLAGRAEVAAASRYVGRLLSESGLLPAGATVAVAPCALRHDLREAALSRPPRPLPSPGEPLRILTLARLHPRKGHLDTVAALALLPAALRAGIVYQVGGGGDMDYLRGIERACRDGGVPFHYLGAIPDYRLADAYAQCDLYAMSSRTLKRSVEGFGLTYLEAGAFGKPVVGYRTGGVAEAVPEGRSGLLVEEGDIAGLSAALGSLIGDQALRHRLGEGGRTHALAQTWEAAVRVLLGEPLAAVQV